MNIISKVTINGKTKINGRYINLTGQNVSITDNGIYVNGKPIEEFDESQVPVLRIEITGNVESLTTENGEVTVNGRVGTVVSKNGNVNCQTVEGNVESKNGNVMCGKIMGDCDTKNGNIMRGY
mgnify:FL=1|jgi:hypothetical protein